MIPLPSGVRVWLATGHTDMRQGFDGLALLVQETLKRDPHGGHLFVFRGRRGVADQGAVARRPGHVPVRQAAGTRPLHLAVDRCAEVRTTVTITPAQLGYLLEGIDWRLPQHTWRPQAAG